MLSNSKFQRCHNTFGLFFSAIAGRLEKSIQGLPPPYRLNVPKLALVTSSEARCQLKPPNYSVNWVIMKQNGECEIHKKYLENISISFHQTKWKLSTVSRGRLFATNIRDWQNKICSGVLVASLHTYPASWIVQLTKIIRKKKQRLLIIK